MLAYGVAGVTVTSQDAVHALGDDHAEDEGAQRHIHSRDEPQDQRFGRGQVRVSQDGQLRTEEERRKGIKLCQQDVPACVCIQILTLPSPMPGMTKMNTAAKLPSIWMTCPMSGTRTAATRDNPNHVLAIMARPLKDSTRDSSSSSTLSAREFDTNSSSASMEVLMRVILSLQHETGLRITLGGEILLCL